ncbi:hypothetical protein D3C87_1686270 [compost metagenome]
MQDLAADLVEHGGGGGAAARQAQHLGPHVGQHHAGEGDGPQAVDLDDAEFGKRSHAGKLDRNIGRRTRDFQPRGTERSTRAFVGPNADNRET